MKNVVLIFLLVSLYWPSLFRLLSNELINSTHRERCANIIYLPFVQSIATPHRKKSFTIIKLTLPHCDIKCAYKVELFIQAIFTLFLAIKKWPVPNCLFYGTWQYKSWKIRGRVLKVIFRNSNQIKISWKCYKYKGNRFW